mgnify:CR=1 FL=1|tara:strand:+ start:596 stop:1606 length:1011 start_codon:yes stop_codon:yes gene_type:complete
MSFRSSPRRLSPRNHNRLRRRGSTSRSTRKYSVKDVKNLVSDLEENEINRNNYDDIKQVLKGSDLDYKEAEDILNIIKNVRETKSKRLTKNNKSKINAILFDGASGSIKDFGEVDDEGLEVSGDVNFEPVCLNNSKSDCPRDKCVYQKGKCLPNILKNERLCFNKDFHSCVKPCKFFGRSVHDKNSCFYFYTNVAEAKEEHKLISDQVKDFEKYVVILRKKAKSLLSFLTYKVRKIDKKLKKLNTLKSKYENELTKSGVDHGEVTERLGEVMKEHTDLVMNKTEADALLTSIKFISELNQTSLNTKKVRKFKGESVLNTSNRKLRNRTRTRSNNYR